MPKFFIVVLLFIPFISQAQIIDYLLVKSPPKAFFKRYHQNLYAWLKEKYIQNSSKALLDKCFIEWIETEEGSSELFFKNSPLKPLLISYEKKASGSSGWYITLISKKPLNCLKGAFGAKWAFSGDISSKFYWEDSKGKCDQVKKSSVLFEKSKNNCIEWRLDQKSDIATIYHRMEPYAKINLLEESKTRELIFYHGYNPFLLGNVPGPMLFDFKRSWKALVRGVSFESSKEYSLYLP